MVAAVAVKILVLNASINVIILFRHHFIRVLL